MNELFAQLFGQSPSYANALFGEDEAARLRQQAQQQGLLNVGLSLLAGAGPSPQRRGVGQLLAQGVAAGQQAYQGAYDKAMRDRMIQEQIQEQQRARAEQQMAQMALPNVIRRPVTEIIGEDIMGQRVGEGVRVAPPQLDINALLSLPIGVQQRLMPQVSATAELIPKLRKAGLTGEQGQQENPFATFIQDPTVPQNVKTLAQQYGRSFATGQLDPDKADERVRQLTEMTQRVQQFQQTQEGIAAQRQQTAELQRSGQAIQLGNQAIQRMMAEAKLEQAREKAEEKATTKQDAKDQLTATVEQLKKNYDTLLQEGGIVSTQAGGMQNIGARISSSGIGKAVGGAVGTKTQEQRQAIEQTRPLLLNLIKNATGMSAQQMNSNAEMQLYLNAATNPDLSYEANMEALKNLDRLFGLGTAAKRIEEDAAKRQKPAGQSKSGW